LGGVENCTFTVAQDTARLALTKREKDIGLAGIDTNANYLCSALTIAGSCDEDGFGRNWQQRQTKAAQPVFSEVGTLFDFLFM